MNNARLHGGRPRSLTAALILCLAVAAPAALAHDLGAPVNDADLHWGPAPAVFAKGAEVAVISGNPFAQGLYVLRLKMPAGYKIAAHNHPTNEYVTVISGTFHLGMGDKLDEAKSITLTAGGFAEAHAKMNHYAWAETPTIVQVHGPGTICHHVCEPGGRSEHVAAEYFNGAQSFCGCALPCLEGCETHSSNRSAPPLLPLGAIAASGRRAGPPTSRNLFTIG
jgi:Domain of unknown function (DUF4437)